MIHVTPCTDGELVKRVVTHPQIYPHVSDDWTHDPAKFDPVPAIASGVFHFLKVEDGGELLGFFIVHRHNAVMYEIHTCLLPHAWGVRAVKAGAAARAWVFTNTPCARLITFVPRHNRLALAFAKRCGMELEGTVRNSFMRDGVLHDQFLLGIGPQK